MLASRFTVARICTTLWCMKTEVYSWRLSSELKSDLERAARHRRVPLSSVLEEAARKWLSESAAKSPTMKTSRNFTPLSSHLLALFPAFIPLTHGPFAK